jgi:hypothetical protein
MRPGSRLQLFGEEDLPAFSPLPSEPFETEAWISCRVHPDYYITNKHTAFIRIPLFFGNNNLILEFIAP